MFSGSLAKTMRRFSICLLTILVVMPLVLPGLFSRSIPVLREFSGFVMLDAFAFDNPDLVGFDPQPILDRTDESDPTNTTFYYHYAGPIDYNGTITWYLSKNLLDSKVAENWADYFSLKQSDGAAVKVSTSDFTYSHTKLSDGNPSNPLTLILKSVFLKPSTSYIIRYKKGYQYKNGSYSTTNSVFTFTTTATSVFTSSSSSAASSVGGSSTGSTSAGGSSIGGSSAGPKGSSAPGFATASGVSHTANISSVCHLSAFSVSSQSTASATGSTSSDLVLQQSSGSPASKGINTMSSTKDGADMCAATMLTIIVVSVTFLAALVRIAWVLLKKSGNPKTLRILDKIKNTVVLFLIYLKRKNN